MASRGGSQRGGRKRSFSTRSKSGLNPNFRPPGTLEPLVSQPAALQPEPQALHTPVSQSAPLQASNLQQAALQSDVSQPPAIQLSSQQASLQFSVTHSTPTQSSHMNEPAVSQSTPPQSSPSTTSHPSVSRGNVIRKVRSKAKGSKLEKHVSSYGKVRLNFTGSGSRPNTKAHNLFLVGECGRLARNTLPFQCTSFGHIQTEDYDALVHRLQRKFVWDLNSKVARKFIHETVQNAYNAWKHPYIKIIKGCPNADDALRQRPVDSISELDWKWLVEYVYSPEFKSLSERNALNRAKQPYNHRGGSKPFIYHVDTEIGHTEDAENTEDQPGEESEDRSVHDEVDLQSIKAVKIFFDTHYSEDKGWINDVAKHTYEQMLSLLQNSESSPDGPPITEFQASQMVLGPKRSYVLGLGRSVIPPHTSEESSSTSTSKDEKIIALMTEMDNMKEREKQMEEKMTRILAVVEQLQRDRPHDDDH